jgi:hypothetical protein
MHAKEAAFEAYMAFPVKFRFHRDACTARPEPAFL